MAAIIGSSSTACRIWPARPTPLPRTPRSLSRRCRLRSYDLGNPAVSSTVTVASNGLNVTAAGSDFGGNSDQGNFSYQLYSGNFDVCVQVAGLSLSDIFAKAGLMARETLTPASRFAAALTTPAMNGSFFEWRDPAGSASQYGRQFPGELSEHLAAAQPRGQHLHRLCQLRRPDLDPAGQRHDLHAQPDLSRLCRGQPHHQFRHHGAIPQILPP